MTSVSHHPMMAATSPNPTIYSKESVLDGASHDHTAHHLFHLTWKDWLAVGGALAATAVVGSPYLIPELLPDSMDAGVAALTIDGMCQSGAENTGAAYQAAEGLIQSIPLAGETLAKGTVLTPLVGTGLIMSAKPIAAGAKRGTEAAMQKFSVFENGRGTEISADQMGKDHPLLDVAETLGKWAVKGVGMTMVLYTALPAIGHGLGYLLLLSDLPPEFSNDLVLPILDQTGATSDWHSELIANNEADVSGALGAITATASTHIACLAGIVGATGSYVKSNNGQALTAADEQALHQQISQSANAGLVLPANEVTPTSSPIIGKVFPTTPLTPFVENERVLQLCWRDTGKPLSKDELAVVHTEPVHMMMNNPSFSDYHHIHPHPTDQAGEYRFTITPQTTDSYRAWVDVKPHAMDAMGITQVDGDMAGLAPVSRPVGPAITKRQQVSSMGDDALVQNLRIDGSGKVGEPQTAVMTIRRKSGAPVELEDIMGAKAHMVGFYPDYQTILHAHPMGEPEVAMDPKDGVQLTFHYTPEMAGQVRLFSQIVVGGKEYGANFSVPVQEQAVTRSV